MHGLRKLTFVVGHVADNIKIWESEFTCILHAVSKNRLVQTQKLGARDNEANAHLFLNKSFNSSHNSEMLSV